MPYELNTFVSLASNEFDLCDLLDIYNWVKNLLMFVTINRYTKIDMFMCLLENGGYLEPEIINDEGNNYGIDSVLSYSDMKEQGSLFFSNVYNLFMHPRRLYLYEDGPVHDFDIVMITGTFEDAFNKYVVKTGYKDEMIKIEKEIKKDELIVMLKNHSKKIKKKYKNDFKNAIKVVNDYSSSLKNKLSFIYNAFIKTMKFDEEKIEKFSFFYNPSNLDKRIKDARNDICHGLESSKIDWRGARNDCIIVQEFIYFIVLKYFLNCSDSKIRHNLNTAFSFNKEVFSDF